MTIARLILAVTIGALVIQEESAAQEVAIQGFGSNGEISWSNSSTGLSRYRIEWAPGANGPWKSTWDQLSSIVAPPGVHTARVALVYRVIAMAAGIPTNGLVAYYPLDGNGTDLSGNTNNLSIVGPVIATDRFGTTNGAYAFDGINDYMTAPSSPSLESPTSQVTISVWANIHAWYGTDWAPLLCKGVSVWQYSFMLDQSGSGYHASAGGPSITLPSLPNLDQWYHHCITYDGTAFVYYRDGEELGRVSFGGALPANAQSLDVGRDVPGAAEYFNGHLDDIRIYNRALSSDEVKILYYSK